MFKITFIGSLKNKDIMDKAAKKLEKMFPYEQIYINVPQSHPSERFESVVREWYRSIADSDLIVAFPKYMDGQFGDGTIYEMEYAKRLGKKVLVWSTENYGKEEDHD